MFTVGDNYAELFDDRKSALVLAHAVDLLEAELFEQCASVRAQSAVTLLLLNTTQLVLFLTLLSLFILDVDIIT